MLLENLRFEAGEEKNDPEFAAALASLADVYVDDAFGAAHRAHASVAALPELLPSAAGRLLQREVEVLSDLRDDPGRPYVAILGGAKVSDKLATISALAERVDALLIGGAMAYTFLKAEGVAVGKSDVLKAGDLLVEVTTYRAEAGYADARHPDEVRYIDDLEADLARRDFTVNAIAEVAGGAMTRVGRRSEPLPALMAEAALAALADAGVDVLYFVDPILDLFQQRLQFGFVIAHTAPQGTA